MHGRYLNYFIPGVVAALIYVYLHYTILGWQEASAAATSDIPLIGSTLSGAANWTLGFMDTFIREGLKFLVLILLSPFNCLLSEKFDTELTGQTFSGGFIRIINDVLRTILIVIFALAMEYIFLALWWLLGVFIPDSLETVLDPVVRFLITSFFFGFAFYDFSLERYGVGNLSSWGFGFSNKAHMMVTGALFTLLMMVSLDLGAFIAPALITMISTATYVRMKGLTLPNVLN